MISCSNPESIAEKGLKEVSSGKYVDIDGHLRFAREGKIFKNLLSSNDKAKAFIDGVDYHEISYFETDILFNHWELINKDKGTIDIYRFSDFTKDNGTKFEGQMYRSYIEIYGKEGTELQDGSKLIKINANGAAILEYKELPIYWLKYKIDKKRMATVTVLNHPEYGYCIVSFLWNR